MNGCKVQITSGKIETGKMKDKRLDAKLGTSHHTKANTSRFHEKANTQALKREEFAFYPSRMGTLVQSETKRKPHAKKIKTATAPSTLTQKQTICLDIKINKLT